MPEKITGVVEVASTKTGGIKIGDKWHNCNEVAKKYVSKVSKGDSVELDLDDDGKVKFIRKLESTPGSNSNAPAAARTQAPLTNEVQRMWAEKELRKHTAMCLAYAKDLIVSKDLTIDKWFDKAEECVKFIYKDRKYADAVHGMPDEEDEKQ
jgi:hypothetical protein